MRRLHMKNQAVRLAHVISDKLNVSSSSLFSISFCHAVCLPLFLLPPLPPPAPAIVSVFLFFFLSLSLDSNFLRQNNMRRKMWPGTKKLSPYFERDCCQRFRLYVAVLSREPNGRSHRNDYSTAMWLRPKNWKGMTIAYYHRITLDIAPWKMNQFSHRHRRWIIKVHTFQ